MFCKIKIVGAWLKAEAGAAVRLVTDWRCGVLLI